MMSHTIPAATLLIGGFALAASWAIDLAVPAPPPITVHSLSYDAGLVTQDRTVIADGEVMLMTWGAQVVNAATGEPVPGCTGSGTWPYEAGRREFSMPLDRWVGSLACLPGMLEPGQYYLRAVYSWQHDAVTAASPMFEVTR